MSWRTRSKYQIWALDAEGTSHRLLACSSKRLARRYGEAYACAIDASHPLRAEITHFAIVTSGEDLADAIWHRRAKP